MNPIENAFQQEERLIREDSRRFKPVPQFRPTIGQPNTKPAKKPAASARELGQVVPDDMVEMQCDTCGGTGWDPGSLDVFGEYCPTCQGSKVELVPLKTLIDLGIALPKMKEVA